MVVSNVMRMIGPLILRFSNVNVLLAEVASCDRSSKLDIRYLCIEYRL